MAATEAIYLTHFAFGAIRTWHWQMIAMIFQNSGEVWGKQHLSVH
jgi:hypothetical protein